MADVSEREPESQPRMCDCIALIGFMGSGKSSVGPLLAAKLGMSFVELDEVVAAGAGKSIENIFADEGEGGFRRRESDALEGELEVGGKVISCGGGVVLSDDNVRVLRGRCRVYLLRISRLTAARRLREHSGRPLLGGVDLEGQINRLMDEREHRYASAAHEVIEADGASPEEIAEEIASRWRRSQCGRQVGNTRSI
jgi:shikimate kinase